MALGRVSPASRALETLETLEGRKGRGGEKVRGERRGERARERQKRKGKFYGRRRLLETEAKARARRRGRGEPGGWGEKSRNNKMPRVRPVVGVHVFLSCAECEVNGCLCFAPHPR